MNKNFILGLALSFLSMGAFAQSTYNEEVDALQAMYGMEKKAVIKELIELTPEEAAKFWPVYDAYEIERKQLGKERLKVLSDLADAYMNMTPEKADKVALETQRLSLASDKLLAKYYKKMKMATNSETALEFYQAEYYLLEEVRAEIVNDIPTYSELKLMRKQ
jgi:hypothetical protein